MFERVLGMGKSGVEGGVGYVKEVKVGYGRLWDDGENVIMYEIEKVDGLVEFVRRGFCREKEDLKGVGEKE